MRLIQAGLGRFGRSWVGVVHDAPGIELVGAVDPLPEARAAAAEAHGLPAGALHTSLADALAADDADAVLVATPPDTHRAVAEEALAAGRHVLVEKPLATTLADAEALVAAADRAGRVLMVSQNYRHRAPARAAQTRFASGALGEPRTVDVTFRRDTRALFPPGDFRYRMRHPLLLDMAIHHLDLVRALTGQDIATAFARSWPVPDSPYQHSPAVAATLVLAGGTVVGYRGDWAPHGPDTSWNGDWTVEGDAGRLTWRGGEQDALTGEVLAAPWGEPLAPVDQPVLPATDRAGSLAALRAAVEDGASAETSGAANLNSLAAVLACVASVESGEAVAVAHARPAAAGGVEPV